MFTSRVKHWELLLKGLKLLFLVSNVGICWSFILKIASFNSNKIMLELSSRRLINNIHIILWEVRILSWIITVKHFTLVLANCGRLMSQKLKFLLIFLFFNFCFIEIIRLLDIVKFPPFIR